MSQRTELHDHTELESQYLECFLDTKCVPQNLFYLLGGARSFAHYRNQDLNHIAWEHEAEFLRTALSYKAGEPWAFVSLGCGNARPGAQLLRHLVGDRPGWHYFGVDSSASMLNLAEENLASLPCPAHAVLADFSKPDFSASLERLLASYEQRLYAMMGGTFVNLDQVWIADLLHELVPEGDYLYLDIVPHYTSDDANVSLRNRLARLPHNLERFFYDLLDRLGVSDECGEVVSDERADAELNTIPYTFSYEVHTPMVLTYAQGSLNLEPGDRLELLTIRAYDVDRLKAFLAEHAFEFQSSYIPETPGLAHLWERLLFRRV